MGASARGLGRIVTEVGVAVTSAGVPGSTVPGGTVPGSAAPGSGAPELFAGGVRGPHGGELAAARPQLIRALNGRLLLGHIRDLGPCSRAELARISGLSVTRGYVNRSVGRRADHLELRDLVAEDVEGRDARGRWHD